MSETSSESRTRSESDVLSRAFSNDDGERAAVVPPGRNLQRERVDLTKAEFRVWKGLKEAQERVGRPLTIAECNEVVGKETKVGKKNRNLYLHYLEKAGALIADESAGRNRGRLVRTEGIAIYVKGALVYPLPADGVLTPKLPAKSGDADIGRVRSSRTKAIVLGPKVREAYVTLLDASRDAGDTAFLTEELQQLLRSVGVKDVNSMIYQLEKAGCMKVVGGTKRSHTNPPRRIVVYRPFRSSRSEQVEIPPECRGEKPPPATPDAPPEAVVTHALPEPAPASTGNGLRSREEIIAELEANRAKLDALDSGEKLRAIDREIAELQSKLAKLQDERALMADDTAERERLQKSIAAGDMLVSQYDLIVSQLQK